MLLTSQAMILTYSDHTQPTWKSRRFRQLMEILIRFDEGFLTHILGICEIHGMAQRYRIHGVLIALDELSKSLHVAVQSLLDQLNISKLVQAIAPYNAFDSSLEICFYIYSANRRGKRKNQCILHRCQQRTHCNLDSEPKLSLLFDLIPSCSIRQQTL
jgi:hypothetical protein